MHNFPRDFYAFQLRAIVLGYIRPELDYISRGTNHLPLDNTEPSTPLEALIEDIETDKRVALNCLERPEYEKYSRDSFFNIFGM